MALPGHHVDPGQARLGPVGDPGEGDVGPQGDVVDPGEGGVRPRGDRPDQGERGLRLDQHRVGPDHRDRGRVQQVVRALEQDVGAVHRLQQPGDQGDRPGRRPSER